MNYKKKYKQALERAKDMLAYKEVRQEDMEYLFPKLKGSEDERIRSGLIKSVSRIPKGYKLFDTDVTREEALAWLEKQGEQKPVDKVEPKFHIGEWIVDNCGYIWKIKGIRNQFYLLEGVEGDESLPMMEWVNKNFHLWTSQDAKDGDVLCYHCSATAFFLIGIFKRVASKDELYGGTYIGRVHYGGYGSIENYTLQVALGNDELHHCGSTACPATKEQRDTLFAKMKEARLRMGC